MVNIFKWFRTKEKIDVRKTKFFKLSLPDASVLYVIQNKDGKDYLFMPDYGWVKYSITDSQKINLIEINSLQMSKEAIRYYLFDQRIQINS